MSQEPNGVQAALCGLTQIRPFLVRRKPFWRRLLGAPALYCKQYRALRSVQVGRWESAKLAWQLSWMILWGI